ncbi:MAG TPA: hypothetical protein VN625_06920 [Desulfuromonadaceae bacterium]|nr:hypothetical protein [Desulfuromonadaceae bacterium]
MLLVLIALLAGCVAVQPTDIRAALLKSARENDPDFPDGKNSMLTHFSHVGQLTTLRGETIYVADERSVTTRALSPHGRNFIVFFDKHFQLLGKMNYVNSRPLWCEGNKLYLFGDLDGLPKHSPGNVVDLGRGFGHLEVYHANIYGSSGGLEDKQP